MKEEHITPIAADLPMPRWYAARKAESGSGKNSVRIKNAKPLNNLLDSVTIFLPRRSFE